MTMHELPQIGKKPSTLVTDYSSLPTAQTIGILTPQNIQFTTLLNPCMSVCNTAAANLLSISSEKSIDDSVFQSFEWSRSEILSFCVQTNRQTKTDRQTERQRKTERNLMQSTIDVGGTPQTGCLVHSGVSIHWTGLNYWTDLFATSYTL